MGYIEELAARDAARQEQNRVKAAEASRVLNQGAPGLAMMSVGYTQDGLSDRDAMMLAQQQGIRDRAYNRDLEAMRNAKVTNGVIDPRYWEAAQRASDYEMVAPSLAERFRQ